MIALSLDLPRSRPSAVGQSGNGVGSEMSHPSSMNWSRKCWPPLLASSETSRSRPFVCSSTLSPFGPLSEKPAHPRLGRFLQVNLVSAAPAKRLAAAARSTAARARGSSRCMKP